MTTGKKTDKLIKRGSLLLLLVLVGGVSLSGFGPFASILGAKEADEPEKIAAIPPAPATQTATGDVITVLRSNDGVVALLDPSSSAWSRAQMTKISLAPQTIVTPNGGGSVSELAVKAIHNDSGLAIRLEWNDDTRDNETVHQVRFRDGVAVQFPTPDTSDTVLSMGSPHGPVNIWHWKADWEPDAPKMNTAPYDEPKASINTSPSVLYSRLHVDSPIEQENAQGKSGPNTGIYNMFGQNAHKSPVEDIVAIGVSSITTKPPNFQILKGRGQWKDGKWNVVIYKPLTPKTKDPTSPVFREGKHINAAFAVWNGANKERNGMKSISNWTSLLFR